MLDRPRHEALMDQVRQVGARITLLSDGDIAAAIMATLEGTGIDVMLGIGGLPEGGRAGFGPHSRGGGMQTRPLRGGRRGGGKGRGAARWSRPGRLYAGRSGRWGGVW